MDNKGNQRYSSSRSRREKEVEGKKRRKRENERRLFSGQLNRSHGILPWERLQESENLNLLVSRTSCDRRKSMSPTLWKRKRKEKKKNKKRYLKRKSPKGVGGEGEGVRQNGVKMRERKKEQNKKRKTKRNDKKKKCKRNFVSIESNIVIILSRKNLSLIE